MSFLKNLRSVAFACVPVLAIVLIVNFCYVPIPNLWKFVVGFALLVFGESIFLLGVESSIVPMGELVSGSAHNSKRFWLILVFGFLFGFFATLAEPDVNVLASELEIFGIEVPKIVFLMVVGFGVGTFVAIGLFRTFSKIPLWIVICCVYIIIFIVCIFVPSNYIAMAFDSGSSTTGVITAPFLIALCSGVSSSFSSKDKKSKDDGFGLIGTTSMGPTLAVLLLFLCVHPRDAVSASSAEAESVFFTSLKTVCLALIPIVIIFFVFEALFLKVGRKTNMRLLIGSLITFVGLYAMLLGLEFGFVGVGKFLGGKFGADNLGWLVILIGGVFGLLVTFAEPAVRVLAEQVENATNHNIKTKFVLIAISCAMFIGVAITSGVVLLKWNISYVILALFVVAILLMFLSSDTFVAIAFDSGGVALGPSSTAFIFPMIVGLSLALGGANTFGTLAILGVVPVIVLECLGVIYRIKTKDFKPKYIGRRRKSVSGVDRYSDVSDLEEYINNTYGG